MSFLTDHKDGCTPVRPCVNCQAVSFVRDKLGKDFNEFLKLLGPDSGAPAIEPIALDTPLNTISAFQKMPSRVRHMLQNDKIVTIEDLVRHTEPMLRRAPNFGSKGMAAIEEALASVGRKLGELPYEPRAVAS